MTQFHDPGYRSILVKNDTSESTVFLYVYPSWLPICWISLASKSIPPKKEYLYRFAKQFKYEIRIEKENKQSIILAPTVHTHNKLLFVTDQGDVIEDDLLNYPFEHQMCVRKNNIDDEVSDEHGRNLYAILKLNMNDIKEKSPEEQDKIIRSAFRRQMFRFHPDRNPNVSTDNHFCQEVAFAYSILGDREKRAQYNDLTKYKGGWLSWSRWKAIFKPEAHGKNERMKRIGLLLLSALSIGGGVLLGFMTAGLAAPVAIALNVSISGALIGGGIQSGLRTVSYDSIANGVNMKKFLQSFAIGAAFGGVAGATTAGITAAMVGFGSSALPVAEMSVSKMVQVGAANGCVNGPMALLSSDADRAFVDGENVTLKEVACHTLIGAALGAAAGAVGGGIAKAVHVSASAATVEGEVVEQGVSKWVTKKAAKHATTFGRIAEKAKRKTLTTVYEVIEEELKKEPEACYSKKGEDFCERSSYEDTNIKDAIFKLYEQKRVYLDPEEDKKERICFICKKGWDSKMIVEYADATKSWKNVEVEGSGSSVEIPEQATNIIVGFRAKRLFKWCDVKKYDRFGKEWCKPKEPHLFMFDTPVSYTFTLDGGPFYEHVSKVTNEDYDEVDLV